MKYQLNDAFPNWLTSGGIFALISAVEGGHDIPWEADSGLLDLDYHGNYSGDKIVSPLVKKMLEADGGTLSIVHAGQLAMIIYNKYIDNWIKRYAALNAEYNPLENYSMVETETAEGTNTGTVGNSRTASGSNTGTVTDAETVDRDTSAQTDTDGTGSIYGYDSESPSPADKQEASTTSTGTEDVSRSNTRTDNLAHSDTESATRTDNLAHTNERELTRSGNIGVTTSQQMLESELEIRKYDFFESVYKDIDKVLTIPIY